MWANRSFALRLVSRTTIIEYSDMAKGSTLQATAATVKRTASGAASSKKASVVLGGGASSTTSSSSKATTTTKKRDAQKALESIAASPRRGSKKASSKQADINDDDEDITEVDVDGNHLRRLKPEDKRYKAYLQDTLRKNLGDKLGLRKFASGYRRCPATFGRHHRIPRQSGA